MQTNINILSVLSFLSIILSSVAVSAAPGVKRTHRNDCNINNYTTPAYIGYVSSTTAQINVITLWQGIDYRLKYGLTNYPDGSWTTTSVIADDTVGDKAFRFNLSSLSVNTKYNYVIECKWNSTFFSIIEAATAPWKTVTSGSFRTLGRANTETFKIAIGSDSHIIGHYNKAGLCGLDTDYLYGYTTFNNIGRHGNEYDMLLTGGDEVMTHAGSNGNCSTPGPNFTTLGTTTQCTVTNDCKARYMGYSFLTSPATRFMPLYFVKGNHDNELSFTVVGSHSSTGISSSIAARPLVMSNVNTPFVNNSACTGCSSVTQAGDYFTFVQGSLRVVGLDTYLFSGSSAPDGPEDYSLGATQLAWFQDVITTATEKNILVIAHHPLGGDTLDGTDYFYGRFNPKATDTDTICGTFDGEFATVIATLKTAADTGKNVVFGMGHDHTATAYDKPTTVACVNSGVHLIVLGKIGGDSPWQSNPVYEQWHDFDNDNYGDYWDGPGTFFGPRGTIARGFFEVEIQGQVGMVWRYRASIIGDATVDPPNTVNDQVVFEYLVQ